jgi:hypothetical protein
VALLLILLALFGFVLAGVGSGSSSSGTARAPAVRERSAQSSLHVKNTSCVVVTWEKGAPAQEHPCRRPPAKP